MLLSFRESVEAALSSALSELGFGTTDLGIEAPPDGIDAVLASSVAFRLTEETNEPPPAIANQIADRIDATEFEYLGEINATGPYVNFHPNLTYYADTLTVAQDETYGELETKAESVIVEHTSANPTGPIHVGRARNPILGDAIARLLEYAGYDTEIHYYVNDAGRQIAVFTWAYERFDPEDLPAADRDRIEYDLVRYYQRGSQFLEEADADHVEAAEAEIQSIMRGLENGDQETYNRVSTVVDQVIQGMRECLSRLPATFDEFIKETTFIKNGSVNDVITRLQATDNAEISEDAWVLNLESEGIENPFVFVRSDGTSLYATRDIAHHEWKLDRADRAVTVLGEDHKLQADQLTTALDLLGTDTSRIDQVFYSWVNLPEGTMSTRAGTGVNLDDLLDEAINRAREEVISRLDSRSRDENLGETDIDTIARQVGIGAVRYDIVSKQPTKGITFKWEEALDFDAQSAPYVQYVHARCCGILTDAREPDAIDPSVLDEPEEKALLKTIAAFPAEVNDAADSLRPHQIATYTRTIAEVFNAFYRECPVLTADDPTVKDNRIALVIATKNTMANALDILGVDAPEVM